MSVRKLVLKKPVLIIAAVIILIVAAVPSFYFYTRYRLAQDQVNNPQAAAQQEARQLVAAVGKIMLLPTDEDPTVATVTDRERLQNQSFFANAANGDKVLIYLKTKKAILYRPSSNKIIDVAPINLNASAAGSLSSPTPTPAPINIAVRNGTQTVGLSKTYEITLTSKLPGATVVDRDNAARLDYTKTYLYDLRGTKATQSAQLAQTLGITVGTLPSDEPVTSLAGKADFLIIVGSDIK
jgi:hypothetical protein